jgi:hypothetical protein
MQMAEQLDLAEEVQQNALIRTGNSALTQIPGGVASGSSTAIGGNGGHGGEGL